MRVGAFAKSKKSPGYLVPSPRYERSSSRIKMTSFYNFVGREIVGDYGENHMEHRMQSLIMCAIKGSYLKREVDIVFSTWPLTPLKMYSKSEDVLVV
jgi:hypothetical protein